MKNKSLAFKVPSAASAYSAEVASARKAGAMPERAKTRAPENLNPYDFAVRQFDRAADHLGLSDGAREVLRNPKRQLIVSIPVKMDDGSIRVFKGYRVQHSIARGRARRWRA